MSFNRAVLFSSQSGDWATPSALYGALNEEFAFDLDPCPLNAVGIDGLQLSWSDRRVFCNPPYGPNLKQWLDKASDAEIAVFLLPARTDTKWFHENVIPLASEIRFLKGRLKFGDAENVAPFPSVIVVFRKAGVQ